MQEFIGGGRLCEFFLSGYRNLKKNMSVVNDLNVFPVPDGDTGTNMVHTFGGGADIICQSDRVDEYTSALARAVLFSARGNSGVIFSQFFSGLARGFEGKGEICFADFKQAFEFAKQDAYASIITPTEGTILTVIRESADFLSEKADGFEDLKSGFEALLERMKSTLAKTPDLLPILKEAGVVDSGGAGFVCFFEGVLAALCGIEVEDIGEIVGSAAVKISAGDFGPDSVMEFGYCTEFILQLMHAKTDISAFDRDSFVSELEKLGNSIVAVASGSIVKVHIHTFAPEKVLEFARRYGEFVTTKIENMSVQHSEISAEEKQKEHYKYAIVATASGNGIIDYFYGIGATAVIDGGQTNNPSVDAFLKAFDSFEAEHIIVLPNNSNIILTANQAAEIYKGAEVHVIPTKSIVEGYSALSMMNLWCDSVDELIADMSSGLSSVTTAYVTTATRDTNMCGVDIKKGNYIALKNKDILFCGEDKTDLAKRLIDKVIAEEEKEIIIVFYGTSVSLSEAEGFKAELENKYPLADIGFIAGEQEVYDYIISLE